MITRIITGLVLLAALIIALIFGGWVFSILWIAAVCIAMYEVFRAISAAGHRPVAWPTWVSLIVSIPCFLLMVSKTGASILITVVYLNFLLVCLNVMFRDNPRLEDMLMSILPLFTVALPGMSMLAMTRMEPILYQRVFLSLTFFVPIVGDSTAYLVGSTYGRIKLNPPISPKKTLEGAAGGLIGSVAAGVLIYAFASAFSADLPPFWHFPLLGFLGGIASQIGDLFASMIKRHCGVKDFGQIFPGHGGMMDRLDSVLFMAVLVYIYQMFMF